MEAVYCFILLSFVLHIVTCIPVSEFYPFGRAVHDHNFPKNDDGSSPRVNISTLFPFFNSQHDSLYVNTNGAISFQQTLNQFTPAPFPLNDHRSIVSPFWADVDIRNGGTVWYRETTASDILQRATNEIRLYYPGQLHFHASWVFIATWDNVAFYGASTTGKTKRNTFQAVLITNGRHSFTVLNYAKVTWTTGTASNGNKNTGLGGTPAQVGFNGGDGVNFYALDESRTPSIVNLARMSNVKTNGKFVFRIDTAKIENGGCNTGGALVVYPFHVTMYGSQEITPNEAGEPRLTLEKTLASSVLVRSASASFILDVETNVIILKMTEVGNNVTLHNSVWSDAFVVKPNMDTNKGQKEAKDTCQRQLNSDMKLPALTDFHIQTCPCRAEQIEIDLARFHRDPLCKDIKYLDHLDFRTSRNCQQAEAQQCYRLNSPGPNGSGRLCCYDYLGNLMDAKSVSGGGTAHRFHYFGGPGSVPYLSTLVFDTSPYFHCCKYIRDTAGLALCARLLQQRPQGDCKNYQPIRPGKHGCHSTKNKQDSFLYLSRHKYALALLTDI
ncbi:uncharacterized protein LOC117322677 [Pecten maximus]|uniref:uncharacterized protein LOC117322677 n=1 Tax=Pecten maximus TaxID=6579 RepID=UPI0014588261|nr:uncharacterized protein LOC117322677 [Pecten maximus]